MRHRFLILPGEEELTLGELNDRLKEYAIPGGTLVLSTKEQQHFRVVMGIGNRLELVPAQSTRIL